MTSKFALVIANTEYTDPGLAQLTAPGKDAKEFGRVLDSPDICAFDDVIVLINENASKVGETTDYFFSLKKPDDLLIMYFSGHGVRDEYGALYLAVKNTNRARLRSTAIKADFIREAMDQSRSRRQVLVLDCCNSGAFAQGSKAETGGSVGTAKAFEGTGYGRVVLTASDSTQFAWEGDKVIGEDTSNSLFTHFLVKGLEGEADQDGDGKITVDELYDYTYGQVVSQTPKQTPGKWSYKQQGDIFLRENLKPRDVKPAPLPADLLDLVTHPNFSVRKAGVQELVALLDGKHLGLIRAAQEKLREVAAADDSLTLRKIATEALSTHGFESDQPMPAEIQKEKPPAPLRPSPSTREAFHLLVRRVKESSLLSKLLEQKLVVPKLERRLLSRILGIAFVIVFLGGVSKLIISGGSILAGKSTPTSTPTRPAAFTSSPTLIITPSFTQTVSRTPTRTPTSTSTLTPTSTPTRTLAPLFTVRPTKRKQSDSGIPGSPVPP